MKLSSRARLSAHTIRDLIEQPMCTKADDVPWCAEAITPQWLSPILCAGVTKAEVDSIAVEDASTGSSVRKRIRVNYNAAGQAAGLQSHFFAKTTPTILTRLTSGPSAGQEAKYFASIDAELEIETPIHVYSTHDRISGRSLHLFEDLVATKQVTFCDYRRQFSKQQLEAVFDLLAKLHGCYYNSPALGDILSWVPSYGVFFDALARTGTQIGHDEARYAARQRIPDRVFEAWHKLWPAAEKGRAFHDGQNHGVIHSDLHPGNWYLTRAGEPGLCDWQCITQGHWSRDFAYAMSAIASVAQRRAWDDELLGYYLRALRRQGGPHVEHGEAKAQYLAQLPGVLLMWTPTLCHPPTMPDMQPEDVSLEMIHRITTAIDDHGVLE